jgi:hypothetical protein
MKNLNKGFNDCVESTRGHWQYFRTYLSNIYHLQYFNENDDEPSIDIELTHEQFNDLRTLFPNIDKNLKERNDVINQLRKSTGKSYEDCLKAYENTNTIDEAISYIKNNSSKLSIDSRFNKK